MRSHSVGVFVRSFRSFSIDRAAPQALRKNEPDFHLKQFVDLVLRQNESRTIVSQGAISSVEVNQLPANSPCEDHHSHAHCLPTDSWMFGVFDGHGGPICSRHISRRLFDYICASMLPQPKKGSKIDVKSNLEWIHTTSEPELSELFKLGHLENVQRFLVDRAEEPAKHTVKQCLEAAFERLDEDISLQAQPNSEGQISTPHLGVAADGSCACVGHVRGPHLHIANTGDSMAVLGVCNERGGWTARQLTQEHCVENPAEVERIKREHPAKEQSSVLRGGRLLGSLYPLRAFGDFAYKWPTQIQETLLHPVYGETSTPPHLDTPPYLTAAPEVFYHKLTPNDRFLVLASDGLWDFLSPDNVVRLVSDHMIGKQTLGPYQPPEEAFIQEVLQDLRIRKAGYEKRPVDGNSATHIIRHALGGTKMEAQYGVLAETLQLPKGVARNFRDDISIIIVYFDQEYLAKKK